MRPIWPDAPPLTTQDTAALAEGFLSDLQQTQLTERGDADFAYANDLGRYRTSVVRQRLGVDLVFRVINTQVQREVHTIVRCGLAWFAPRRFRM